MADYDNPDHQEGDSNSVGDRRQEIVFIGQRLTNPGKQDAIGSSLDRCLLTDAEWSTFCSNVNDEGKLRSVFGSISSRAITY